MKKKSLILLLALAIAAFFAHSPHALRVICQGLRGNTGTSEMHESSSDTVKYLKAANQPELVQVKAETSSDSGIGGDAITSEADPDPAAENERIARAVAQIPDAELRQALERALTDDSAGEYRALLQRRWAEINPSAAAVWATRLTDSAKALPLVQQTAIVWANMDISAATAWAASLPKGELRTAAIISIGYEAARSLSFEAFDLVVGLEPSVERDTLLEHIARQWSASDANQAFAWVNQIPVQGLRQQLLGVLASTAADHDGPTAAGFVADGMNPGPNQNRAAVQVVQRWVQTDPDAAAAWVEQFADSDVKRAAESALAN